MWSYVVRRLLATIPVLLGITFITFWISHKVPVDPAVALAGDSAPQSTIQAIRARYGLDKPWPVQYLLYVRQLVRGDLGTSIFTGDPVTQDLRQYFAATVELSTAAIVVSVLIAVPAAVAAATHRNGLFDHVSRVAALIGASMPTFWLALLLVMVFYFKLGWFPPGGRLDMGMTAPPFITGSIILDSLLTGRWRTLWSGLDHLALPALTLGYMGAGMITRITRSSMLEVLSQDYIRTARAKGLNSRRVTYRHALKNALLPTVTVIGLTYGALLGGAVLTESIFAWPGLGRYAVISMLRVDFPAVMGVVLVMTVVYAAVNLLVDLAYGWIDPRIRYT